MYSRPQLSGDTAYSRQSQVGDSQQPPSRAALVVIFCLFFCGGCYLLFTYMPSITAKSEQTGTAAPALAPIPLSEAEDLVRHLENATSMQLKASGEIKRSQDWMERVLPGLDQHYLGVEKRRLDAARAASLAARRYGEQAREELELVKNLIQERSKP